MYRCEPGLCVTVFTSGNVEDKFRMGPTTLIFFCYISLLILYVPYYMNVLFYSIM